MPDTISKIEEKAQKYIDNNVSQCWKCKNKGSDCVFKREKEDGIEYIRLPECVKYHCYVTQLDPGVCPDYLN